MATRTIQFLGQGYNSEPVSVIATWDGNTLYNGTVPTTDAPLPDAGFTPAEIMFTHDVDVTLQAETPMSIEVLTGTLVIGRIVGNYANVVTQSGNTWVNSSSGPDVYLTVNNYINVEDPSNQDVRNNVLINGQPVTPTRNPTSTGTWCYTIPAGSTITFNVEVDSGLI